MSIFQEVKPNIDHNDHLYPPQISAYRAALSHYQEFQEPKYRETLIVMPTGSGKTGVMAMLPFELSTGRVLIITPGKIVRKTVFKEFDSLTNPENTFWYKRRVILDRKKFPKSYLYQGFNTNDENAKQQMLVKLDIADIVITNIHKIVGSSEEVNLKGLVSPDFFDMIIIDEAHHVAADMWQKTLDYFQATKVIKLTATPFRSDNLSITSNEYDPIYEYTLAEAIQDGLVKNVVKAEDIADVMEFIDLKTGRRLTLEQAKREMGNDWVSKSVAMSKDSSMQVIAHTKEVLQLKRKSYPHHQVLAITCNDEHAQSVTSWFEESGLSCTYVSSRLPEQEIEIRLTDFANGKYDVMVSIQMLGEGYDNPNISVVSIFRPFKTLSPYAQAIGRGLRKISAKDSFGMNNFCNVVYHKELGLEELWNYYKTQEAYGDILKQQIVTISEQLSFAFDELGYVEKQPAGRKSNPSDDLEPNSGKVVNIGLLRSYSSRGMGNQDSFTKDGYNDYLQATYAILNAEETKLQSSIQRMKDLVSSGILSEEQAQTLIAQEEAKIQGEYDDTFSAYHELVMGERMRSDFISWMNLKIEEFFKTSVLQKEGFDLFEAEDITGISKINNVGYIVRNFRQGLFQETRKKVSSYLPQDYALAKKRLLEKLDFYLNQFGKKEE